MLINTLIYLVWTLFDYMGFKNKLKTTIKKYKNHLNIVKNGKKNG